MKLLDVNTVCSHSLLLIIVHILRRSQKYRSYVNSLIAACKQINTQNSAIP
jgi:hypothetical protein